MGDVAAVLKVMPENADVDMERIKSSIKEIVEQSGMSLQSIEEKPVAFGLKMLEVLVVTNKGTDEIEEKIKSIEGVASVEPGDVTLI